MFSLLKQQPSTGTQVLFHIDGMHCTSCALNIDGALEDLDGVKSAQTNYARSTTKVIFDETKITSKVLEKTIEGEGYTVKKSEVGK